MLTIVDDIKNFNNIAQIIVNADLPQNTEIKIHKLPIILLSKFASCYEFVLWDRDA